MQFCFCWVGQRHSSLCQLKCQKRATPVLERAGGKMISLKTLTAVYYVKSAVLFIKH